MMLFISFTEPLQRRPCWPLLYLACSKVDGLYDVAGKLVICDAKLCLASDNPKQKVG